MSNEEHQNNINIGWYHLKNLKAIAQTGAWPQGLTPCERKTLRVNNLIEVKYVPQQGKMPFLTQLAETILGSPLQTTLLKYIKK